MDLQQQKAIILDALLEHKGVAHVLSAASIVLNNPIMMVSRTGTDVGLSCTEEFGKDYWDGFHKALPLEQAFVEIEAKSIASQLLATDEVISSHFDHADISVMGARVRDRIDVLGYISMVVENPPIETTAQILVATARMLSMELVYQSQHVSQRDEDSALIYELIAGVNDQNDVTAFERSRGMKQGGQMRLIAAEYPPAMDASLFLAKSALSFNIDCLLCGIYNSHAILVVDETLFDDNMLAEISHCIGRCDGVGVSRLFTSLEALPHAFREASSAIRIAKHLGNGNEISWYSDLATYHLLERASTHDDLMRYLDPAVKRIIEYDEENGTDLTTTLRAYVDSGRNMSICADRLFTHRNTVHYRIKRIQELVGLDRIDDNRWLSIGLSFRILDIIDR